MGDDEEKRDKALISLCYIHERGEQKQVVPIDSQYDADHLPQLTIRSSSSISQPSKPSFIAFASLRCMWRLYVSKVRSLLVSQSTVRRIIMMPYVSFVR